MLRKFKSISGYGIILFIIVILIYWNWWLPGVRVATDYPFMSDKWLITLFDIPRLWNFRGAAGMGEFGSFILWSYPFTLVSGILANLKLGFNFQERFLYIIPIILFSFYGVRKLLKSYGISESGIFIASLFYVTTTYLILLIDGGQLSIALGYSLFPLAYWVYVKSVTSGWRVKLITCLLLFLLVSSDVRLLFIFLIILVTRFVYVLLLNKNRLKLTGAWIITGSLIGGLLILLSLYWLIPLAIYPLSSQVVSALTQNIGIQPVTWKHAFLIFQPQWYKNVFGAVGPVNYVFILIPILAFTAPVLSYFSNKKALREIFFWVGVAFVGIFLTKGSNPPFGNLYSYLFDHTFVFSLFRDSSKFFVLTCLAYSILLGFTVNELTKRFNLSFRILNLPLNVIPLLFAAYIIVLVGPVWMGKMTGTFTKPYESEYFDSVSGYINRDIGFGRVFWIPSLAPLGYSSPGHPSVEGLRLVSLRPFEIGTVGTYEILNYPREAPFMGEIFKVAGIKYIVYPYPDTRREVLKQDNIDYYYAFLDQLKNLAWIKAQLTNPPVPLLETKDSEDHFFIAPNTYYIVGSDSIYNKLINIPNFDLAKNALIFAEEKPQTVDNLNTIPSPYIILFDKGETDLAASFISSDKMIYPASDLPLSPTTESQYWKRETSDFLWMRNFLQSKYSLDNQDFDYGGGYSIAEGNRDLQITNRKLEMGNILLARVMKSSRGGKVSFYQGDSLIGEINTKVTNPEKVEIKLTGYGNIQDQIFTYDKADFNWYEVGQLINDQQITVKTKGDINIINVLASARPDEWNGVNRKTASSTIFDWNKMNDNDRLRLFTSSENPIISYTEISPTHYKVQVSELKYPVTLAFSETYNNLWQANGTSSYPLYSLINGFRIDNDGVYDINFYPQKYVLPGLILSAVTFLLIVLGLTFIKKNISSN